MATTRKRALAGTAALVAAVLAAACGRLAGPGAGTIEHPAGPEGLVLRVERGGGFVPLEWALRRIPGFSLYGDGRYIVEGPQIEIYPGPALPNLLQGRMTEDGIQAALRAARDAGLLEGDRHLDWPTVADADTATLTVRAAGRTSVVSAYALGLEEGGPPPPGVSRDEVELRGRLLAFEQKLWALSDWLPRGSVTPADEPYRFDALRVYVRPYPGPPEPALEQAEVSWPLPEPLAAYGEPVAGMPDTRCGVVLGEDLDRLLLVARDSNQLSPWVSQGAPFLLILRPLLPDESGC